MRSIPFVALALGLLASCRPGEGGRCVCQGECRGGLVCAVGGTVLGEGRCVDSVSDDLEAGECIDQGNAPEEDDPLDPDPHFDLGTKRDFEPGSADLESSSSTASTTDSMTSTTSTNGSTTSTSDSTTSTTDSTTSTSTTDSTSSSSSSSTTSTDTDAQTSTT